MDPLLQHRLQGEADGLRAWRVIVVSLLLKRTRSPVAERVAREVFAKWPRADLLARADDRLVDVLKPAGLAKQRGEELRRVSAAYWLWLEDTVAGGGNEYSGHHGPPPGLVRSWKGCGQYVEDAVRLLVHHELADAPPADKELRRWWEHLQTVEAVR